VRLPFSRLNPFALPAISGVKNPALEGKNSQPDRAFAKASNRASDGLKKTKKTLCVQYFTTGDFALGA
jgi:hypothetical protein